MSDQSKNQPVTPVTPVQDADTVFVLDVSMPSLRSEDESAGYPHADALMTTDKRGIVITVPWSELRKYDGDPTDPDNYRPCIHPSKVREKDGKTTGGKTYVAYAVLPEGCKVMTPEGIREMRGGLNLRWQRPRSNVKAS